MKALYLFAMFSTSSVIGIYYGYAASERQKTIEELINFFKYLVIKISAKNGNLLYCIQTYKESKRIEDFLAVLQEHLEYGSTRPFEPAAKKLTALTVDERNFVKGLCVGSLDYSGQLKALEQAICQLETTRAKLEDDSKKNKVASYSGVLVGVALVIIFI